MPLGYELNELPARSLRRLADRAAVPERANVAYAPKSVGSEGTLSKITSVQRVNTAAGVAPKSGCSSATAGTQVRVDYTADYYFFAAR